MNKLVEHLLKTTVGLYSDYDHYSKLWYYYIPIVVGEDLGIRPEYKLYIRFTSLQRFGDGQYEFIYVSIDRLTYNMYTSNQLANKRIPICFNTLKCSFNDDGLAIDNSSDVSYFDTLKLMLDAFMPKIMAKLIWFNAFTNNGLGIDRIKYIPKEFEPESKIQSDLKSKIDSVISKIIAFNRKRFGNK